MAFTKKMLKKLKKPKYPFERESLSTVKNKCSRQATKNFDFLSLLMWETRKVLVEFHSQLQSTPLMRSPPPPQMTACYSPQPSFPPILIGIFSPSYVIIKRSPSPLVGCGGLLSFPPSIPSASPPDPVGILERDSCMYTMRACQHIFSFP